MIIKKIRTICLFVCLLLFMAGCGQEAEKETEPGTIFQIYTVNKEETRVNSYECRLDLSGKNAVGALLKKLKEPPQDAGDRAAITENVKVLNYASNDKSWEINFSESYSRYSLTGEVLSRAAIVRTLCQLPEVEYVTFLIEGKELMNTNGVNVGMMNADTFVENNGSEINSYEKASLKLYFADESGEQLKTYEKEVVYNSNISLEKLVVEQLVAGPDAAQKEYRATIQPQTKVLSVTVKDGTCYVNLDGTVLTPMENIDPEVTIYSIVNSLTELTNVYKVQISIDGNTDMSFLEKVSLATPLERNYDLME
ncbi:MAG: hypothetical protein E7294_13560 [Lachnospiraceae bacterium]|nr:hypothetical protein [Lachnospiraceae bacterium]